MKKEIIESFEKPLKLSKLSKQDFEGKAMSRSYSKSSIIILVFAIFLVSAIKISGQETENDLVMLSLQKNLETGEFSIVEMNKLHYTSNLAPTTGSEYTILLRDETGNVVSEGSFDLIPFTFMEQLDENGVFTDGSFSEASSALVIVSIPATAQTAQIVDGERITRGYFDLRVFQGCIADGVCEFGVENYLTCSADCSSGGYDGECNKAEDGECDIDCANKYGRISSLDSDCQEPICSLEESRQWPPKRICSNNYLVYECLLNAEGNPFSLFRENCPGGCDAETGRCISQTTGGNTYLTQITPSPMCKTNLDCIVNQGRGDEQWNCVCGTCYRELNETRMCCAEISI